MKSGSQAFGCGQCNPCRFNRRRLWTNRLMLEQLCHAGSSFVTLTYRSEALPPGGTLVKKDYQDWLKNLRKAAGIPLRYYVVGEYGEQNQRPHYHAALYGIPGCLNQFDEFNRRSCDCYSCSIIRKSWKKGLTDCAYLEEKSAQYIAGYIVKRMTSPSDPRLNGRLPEFGQPSLKPGIGALAVPFIADVLTTDAGCNEIISTGDVPLALKRGVKNFPLGRYLRSKLRGQLGFKQTSTPQEALLQAQTEMCVLLEEALKKPENKSKSIKNILLTLNKQKVLNLESRMNIFSKKGSL